MQFQDYKHKYTILKKKYFELKISGGRENLLPPLPPISNTEGYITIPKENIREQIKNAKTEKELSYLKKIIDDDALGYLIDDKIDELKLKKLSEIVDENFKKIQENARYIKETTDDTDENAEKIEQIHKATDENFKKIQENATNIKETSVDTDANSKKIQDAAEDNDNIAAEDNNIAAEDKNTDKKDENTGSVW